MKPLVLVLCWVGLWLLGILAAVPTLFLLLFLILREKAREHRVGQRLRQWQRQWLLRAKLVYLRCRERRQAEHPFVPSGPPPRVSICGKHYVPDRRPGRRTIFRDVALF